MSDLERARPLIEAALAHGPGTHGIEDIERGIAEGGLLLLAGERSAIVAEIIAYPRMKALNLFLMAGDLAEIRKADPMLREIARLHGCTHMTGFGRPGFQRALRDLGVKPAWTMFVRELP